MYSKQPKKLLMYYILEILKDRTDSEHTLSQKQIEEILIKDYDMSADRKSIKRNLMDLIECGYEIGFSETSRTGKNRKTGKEEENVIYSDFYLERDYADSELRLLIDGLLFSTHLPYSQCKNLVEKIEKLSNRYFMSRVRHISKMPEDRTDNQQIFYNIDIIDEAIEIGKKIVFHYTEYTAGKRAIKKKDENGEVREYVVSPYQMAAKEGKYYLICNYDKYDDISNYRMDRIVDIRIIDEPIRPFKTLKGSGGRALDLSEYMKEHIYMYSGDSVRAKLRIVRPMITDLIDLFGNKVTFTDEDDTHVTAMVKAGEEALKQFAKNFAPDVIVLEPKKLRDTVKEELEKGVKGYE